MKMRCKFSKTMAQGEKIPMFQNNAYFLSSIVSLGYLSAHKSFCTPQDFRRGT